VKVLKLLILLEITPLVANNYR